VSQLLTLFTTPVVYLYMDKLRLIGHKREHQLAGNVAPQISPARDLRTS
jgi:hypothetical protein